MAEFSSCGLYRWCLRRRLSLEKKTIIFIGLNPSRADSKFDDPTLRRLMKLGGKWGYGNLIVVNLFARISASPAILRKSYDPIGKRNDKELSDHFFDWSKNAMCDLWLGWGNQGVLKHRNIDVMRLLEEHSINRSFKHPKAFGPLVLGLTSKGHPRHPLYCSNQVFLTPLSCL